MLCCVRQAMGGGYESRQPSVLSHQLKADERRQDIFAFSSVY